MMDTFGNDDMVNDASCGNHHFNLALAHMIVEPVEVPIHKFDGFCLIVFCVNPLSLGLVV
jgi:hypothetical protein